MSISNKRKWLTSLNTGKDFPYRILDNRESSISCGPCESLVKVSCKVQLQQHLKTSRHMSNLKLKETHVAKNQAHIEDVLQKKKNPSKSEEIGRELCSVFLAANIPWSKLEHPKFRVFLEERLAVSIPNESSLRKNYMPQCYEEVSSQIRADLSGFPIWISVDESSDCLGRAVANVICGRLDAEKYHQPHLVLCKFLERTDSESLPVL